MSNYVLIFLSVFFYTHQYGLYTRSVELLSISLCVATMLARGERAEKKEGDALSKKERNKKQQDDSGTSRKYNFTFLTISRPSILRYNYIEKGGEILPVLHAVVRCGEIWLSIGLSQSH